MKIEYHNIYIHFVLTVYHRMPLITEEVRPRLEQFIQGVVKNNESRVYAIFANPEHLHLLVSKSPQISEVFLMKKVAAASEQFLHNICLLKDFCWQDTCSAFSVSQRGVDEVCRYILNQRAHHQKFSWEDEYKEFVKHYQKTLTRD